MRNFKFEYQPPVKVARTIVEKAARIDGDGQALYSKFSLVTTKTGLVAVTELDWRHNTGTDRFTHFTTVKDGFRYSAYIKETRLIDIKLKWLATHFMKHLPIP